MGNKQAEENLIASLSPFVSGETKQRKEEARKEAIERERRVKEETIRREREQAKQQLGTINLVLLSWRWSISYGYAIAEGRVKNVSGQKLSNVQAVFETYDANDNFISSGSALIEYDPILANQTSPFKVMLRYNPAMKTGWVTFKVLMGGQLSSVSKKEYNELKGKAR